MEHVQFGELGRDGGISRDVNTCSLTGKKIEIGDMMVKIAGTRFFYRISADASALFTPEVRADIEALIPRPQVKTAPAPVKEAKGE